jgi:hypothetical protein
VVAAANVADIAKTAELLHGQETQVHADAGYIGVEKRPTAGFRPEPARQPEPSTAIFRRCERFPKPQLLKFGKNRLIQRSLSFTSNSPYSFI